MDNILLQLLISQLIPLCLIYAKLCGKNTNGTCSYSVSDYQNLAQNHTKYMTFLNVNTWVWHITWNVHLLLWYNTLTVQAKYKKFVGYFKYTS